MSADIHPETATYLRGVDPFANEQDLITAIVDFHQLARLTPAIADVEKCQACDKVWEKAVESPDPNVPARGQCRLHTLTKKEQHVLDLENLIGCYATPEEAVAVYAEEWADQTLNDPIVVARSMLRAFTTIFREAAKTGVGRESMDERRRELACDLNDEICFIHRALGTKPGEKL